MYDAYQSGLQSDVNEMAAVQFDTVLASHATTAKLSHVSSQNHRADTGVVNWISNQIYHHENDAWARGIMGFAGIMNSNAMHIALQATNRFTRDLMGDVAGSYGTQYFDDLQNGRSSFADAAKFIGADLDVQAMGEVGGVVFGYVAKTTSSLMPFMSRFFDDGITDSAEKYTAQYRADRMLNKNIGYNVTSEDVFNNYSYIGKDGTYITDYRAIAEIIGPVRANSKFNVGLFGSRNQVSYLKTLRLEKALGLKTGSLTKGGFRFSKVPNIIERQPRCPLEGNKYFIDPGAGLPNGGPELVIDSISTQQWPEMKI